jgi:hypothetical protein
MFKRLFWLTVGVLAGLSGSYWIQRRVRHAVDRLAPESVQADVRAAWNEGRIATRTKEIELRQRYRPRGRQPAHR